MAIKSNINATLLNISEELSDEEVRDLSFLCSDHFSAGQNIKTALKIFTQLQQLDLDIIPELLYRIQRFNLLSKLGKRKADVEIFLQHRENCKISNYRVLLYDLSKQLDDEDLNRIKFILKVEKSKWQDIKNFMDVCTDLERKESLAPDNLQLLLSIMGNIKRLDLRKKLEKYQNVTDVTLPQEESRGKTKDIEEPTQETRCPAQVDAKPVGTKSHKDLQQAPSTVDDPAVEMPHLQGAGGSTTKQNSNAMANLQSAMEAISVESAPVETSTASSMDAVAGPPPRPSAQTVSNSEGNQRNFQRIEVYKMDSSPLGNCLILNNSLFPGTMYKERNGTENDAARLDKVFKKLGFEIYRHDNLTVESMKETLQKYQKRDHHNIDCFVCCILSHGEKDAIVGTDGNLLDIKDIRSMFSGSQCPSLLEKPKVFFIQACQGTRSQTACPVMENVTSSNSDLESDAMSYSIAEDRDFLVGMSTVPDCVSYRTSEGSWFIQTLCACLEEYCWQGYDLLTILTEVNRRVSEKHRDKKQIPEPRFTLSKKLIILPPSTQTTNS
ncbi:caspase-8-like [Heptranchias perlo]|uniref:caspase-8-like n=1 Tax=Heptranchias perlo TaxID=212740 RepID=UPI003559EDCD